MTTTETETQSTELEVLVGKAVEKINSGALSMSDLLKALAPHAVAEGKPSTPTPTAAVISDDERKALAKVVEVFGQVCPTEKRALLATEQDALIEEKQCLDTVKKMAEKRLTEGIRTIVFNHFDTEAEADEDFDPEQVERDKSGFLLTDGEAPGTGNTGKKFTREVREGAPTLDVDGLKALADDPDFEEFTHKDFLAMTRQVRVVDENRVMEVLKKKPTLVTAIARATKPGKKTVSLNLRAT